MTTPTHSHKPWTDKGGHVNCMRLLAKKMTPFGDMDITLSRSFCRSVPAKGLRCFFFRFLFLFSCFLALLVFLPVFAGRLEVVSAKLFAPLA
jgi:hypothetical protein